MSDSNISAYHQNKSLVENTKKIDINSVEWKKYDDNIRSQCDQDHGFELTEGAAILAQALAYKQSELSVIALVSKSKKPQHLKWEEYQHVIANEEQLNQWFSTSGQHNVGIITGAVSKILVIDIDGQEAQTRFHERIEEIQDKDLLMSINKTMKIKTGSGNINVVIGFNPNEFEDNKDETKNRILWKGNEEGHSEIRVKGEGGYVVAPPSIHPNGHKYELINGLDIVLFSKDQIQTIFEVLSTKDNCNKFARDTPQHWLDGETISFLFSIANCILRQYLLNNCC
jgi:Bifunctional DNA primase/polymerase, N-terminal